MIVQSKCRTRSALRCHSISIYILLFFYSNYWWNDSSKRTFFGITVFIVTCPSSLVFVFALFVLLSLVVSENEHQDKLIALGITYSRLIKARAPLCHRILTGGERQKRKTLDSLEKLNNSTAMDTKQESNPKPLIPLFHNRLVYPEFLIKFLKLIKTALLVSSAEMISGSLV